MQFIIRLANSEYCNDYYTNIRKLQHLYKVNGKSPELEAYFQKFATFVETLFILLLVIFITNPIALILAPIYTYFTEGNLSPIIYLYAPGIDENTIIGFLILNLFHMYINLLGIFIFVGLEFLVIVIIINSLVFAKLIGRQLQQIEDDSKEIDCDMIGISARLRNVFLMHQEMGEYMERVDNITFRTYFVQICSSTFGAIVGFYPSFIVSPLFCIIVYH